MKINYQISKSAKHQISYWAEESILRTNTNDQQILETGVSNPLPLENFKLNFEIFGRVLAATLMMESTTCDPVLTMEVLLSGMSTVVSVHMAPNGS